MHVVRLHPAPSEFDTEEGTSAADFASGGGESFSIGFGGGSSNRRVKRDPRECMMT
jgi:hypothetical protein